MKYQELVDRTKALYDKFEAGDKEQMFKCLSVLSHNPNYSVKNSLLLCDQLGKPPRHVFRRQTDQDISDWEEKGRYVKSGSKQLSYWYPSKFKDENGTTRTKFMMTWGYDISQTNEIYQKPQLSLEDIAQYLIDKYDIKVSSGIGIGAPCLKIDKNHIVYDAYAPYKDSVKSSIGEILRCICPGCKPKAIGGMVVYHFTGDYKYLLNEVNREDVPLLPADIKNIKDKYKVLFTDLCIYEKQKVKSLTREEEPDKNKDLNEYGIYEL